MLATKFAKLVRFVSMIIYWCYDLQTANSSFCESHSLIFLATCANQLLLLSSKADAILVLCSGLSRAYVVLGIAQGESRASTVNRVRMGPESTKCAGMRCPAL